MKLRGLIIAGIVPISIFMAGCAGKSVPAGDLTASKLDGKGAPPVLSLKEPLGLIVGAAPQVTTPDWQRRAQDRALFFGGTGSSNGEGVSPVGKAVAMDVDLLLGGGNIYVLPFSAPVGALHLLYLPVGYTIGKISGNAAVKKWQPCMTAFGEAMKRFDLSEAFRREVVAWGEKHDAMGTISDDKGEGQSMPRYVLRIDLGRIMVRECDERNSFCLELSSIVKLLEGDKEIYCRSYVYSNRVGDSGGYESVVSRTSVCRELDDYCGNPNSPDKFIADVRRGIQAMTEAALQDIFILPEASPADNSLNP